MDPEHPELHHLWLFRLLEKAEKEEQYLGKLDIDNFCHRLSLPEYFCTFFGLPPIYIGGNGEKCGRD